MTVNNEMRPLLEIDRLLARPDVMALTGMSTAGIYAAMTAGTFPRPLRVSPRSVRWKLSDLRAWMETCERSTGGGGGPGRPPASKPSAPDDVE
jgi:prophage regulatory protein